MGMDVYGKNPRGYIDGDEDDPKAGVYFRANIWWWGPLWRYVEYAFPDIAQKVEYAYFNDGDGLNSRDSVRLAKGLRHTLDDGSLDKYITDVSAQIASQPDEQCELCNGTGQRTDKLAAELGITGTCNVCDGKGMRRPYIDELCLDRKIVEEFADFLENCGGFEIW